jgi:hypothetical protein
MSKKVLSACLAGIGVTLADVAGLMTIDDEFKVRRNGAAPSGRERTRCAARAHLRRPRACADRARACADRAPASPNAAEGSAAPLSLSLSLSRR